MKKILIIRMSSIGDIVLTTPVVRCLKNQLTDVEIHYVVKSQFYDVVRENPYIDKIHTFNKEDGLKVLAKALKSEKFDFVVDLHKNFRSLYLKKFLGVPSASFPKLNRKKWLLVNFKINKLPDIHIVDRYFMAVKSFNIKNDGKGLDYFIPENEKSGFDDMPFSLNEKYIGFVIGAKHNTKALPSEKIFEIIKGIRRKVILLGGPEDVEKSRTIMKNCNPEYVYDACGKYSVNQSAYLVEQATKIITSDTGLMHIAAALGKEILSVWGNTVPEFGMYPYLPEGISDLSVVIENKGLSCRPCSKIGYSKCPKKHFKCMMDIDVQKIIDWANG